MSRGRVYLRLGDERHALREFKAALSVNTQNAVRSALVVLEAMRSLSPRRSEMQEAVCREALGIQARNPLPQVVQLQFALGVSLYRQGRYREADDSFAEALRLDGTNRKAIVGRSEALRKLGMCWLARLVVDEAQRRSDTATLRTELALILADQGSAEEARRVCERVCREAGPSDRENAKAALGRILSGSGAHEEAANVFRQLIGEYPKSSLSPMYMLQLAYCLLGADESVRSSRQREAEDWCTRAERTSADYAPIYGCRARIAQLNGQTAAAEELLRAAVRLDPFSPHRIDLAAILIDTGRHEEARKILDRVAHPGTDSRACLQLGRLSLTADRYGDARRYFQEALRLDPLDEAAIQDLADTFCRLDQTMDAERTLREGIGRLKQQGRTTWRLHRSLAKLLSQRGLSTQDSDDLSAALQEVQSAIREHREDPGLYHCQGQIPTQLSQATPDLWKRQTLRRQALRDFNTCNEKHKRQYGIEHPMAPVCAEALRTTRGQDDVLIRSGYAVSALNLVLLLSLWIGFFLKQVTSSVLLTLAPITLGCLIVALLLPTLNRLKLPGVEADVQSRVDLGSGWKHEEVDFGQIAATMIPAPRTEPPDLGDEPFIRPLRPTTPLRKAPA